MKKILLLTALMAITMVGCGKKDKENDGAEPGMTTADSLRMALANQDSLLVLMNDINEDMMTIKQMENILSNPGDLTSEAKSARKKMHDDMLSIQATLQQRRERLEELEKKLAASNRNAATLQKTIETLKQQIAEQEQQIESYKEIIAGQNEKIREQGNEIASLNENLTSVTEAKNQAEEEVVQKTNEINTVYYTIGTKKELNNNAVIKSGFLRKTKILPGDVDTKFFTQADKRTLLEINCHSKKAEVMTDQPKSSYEFITEANGDKILVIKNADEFWKKSPFLVIKVD